MNRLQVKKLPVTAFKRNGMQDQEHSLILGTPNFLTRNPRDVSIECPVCCESNLEFFDPVKVPTCNNKCPELCCKLLKRKPIQVYLQDLLNDD